VNPEHLFLGTPQANMDDKMRKGRHRVCRGEELPTTKLTAEDVRAILVDNRSQRALARLYGVSQSSISFIKRRATWRHILPAEAA
jgi:hypothetical protein